MMKERKRGKAPGKSHRKGLALKDLFKMFPDDSTAEKWFVQQRWPNGVACPYCKSEKVREKVKHPTMPYRCRSCYKYFSVKTGTTMQSSNLGYQTWALATYLMMTNIKGVSSMRLHRELNIAQKNAWHLAHRIRESWDEKHDLFSSPVEVDETYIGGKERNKHDSKKLNAGRGAVGKTAVIGAKNRETKKVSAAVVENTDQESLQGFIRNKIEPGSTVYTDDHKGYAGLCLDFDHQTVRHSVREYVNDQAHTNGIESFWAMLKRGYYGTYHRMSEKHLDRYVNEFSGRHNVRELDTLDQMRSVTEGMRGKRLRYQDLVG